MPAFLWWSRDQFSISKNHQYPLLRILHISSAQSFGGGERHLADLANGLAHRGHDVYAALRPNSQLIEKLTELREANVTILPFRNALDANSAHHLAIFVRKNAIEIAHAHMARDYPLAAYATRRNATARLIVTRHVLFPLNRLHKITLSHAARIIAVSEAVALQLRSQKLAPPGRIRVVHNGIDIGRFEKARADFNREQFSRSWNLPEHGLLVGTVGELNTLKGHEEFLRAAEQIARIFSNAYFVVAGVDTSETEENRTALKRLIRELGLVDRVRLVGWLDDVAQLLCALDVFVSASRIEAFGLVIGEAMACGTAVVATETQGAREIIEDRETGLLVPVADADALAKSVIALLKDEERREEIGKQARKVVHANFSLDRMVDATEKIYRESLSGK